MKRTTPFKALIIASFALQGVACADPAATTRPAATNAASSTPDPADPPSGIINREEYEHSPSFPPG